MFHGSITYKAETGEKRLGRVYPGNRLFTFVLDGKEPMPPMPSTDTAASQK